MGVKISIQDDTDRSLITEYPCVCLDEQGIAHEGCRECEGSGKVRFAESQWEEHWCYSTLAQVLIDLGLSELNFEYGHIPGERILEKAKNPLVRMQAAAWGRGLERLAALERLAHEAAKRRKHIIWG